MQLCESQKNKREKGATLIEILLWIVIFGILILAASTLFVDTVKTSRYTHATLIDQANLHKVIQPFASEIREARQAATGEFMIEVANENEFVFYSDTDNDDIPERISYKKEGDTFKKEKGGELEYQIENLSEDFPLMRYFNEENSEPEIITQIRSIEITIVVPPSDNSDRADFVARTRGVLRNVYDL